MKRKTIAGLEARIEILEPYQEAYFALSSGEERVIVSSGERSIAVLGLARGCGGVVVEYDGERGCVQWVSTVMAAYSQTTDPYFREIANKVFKLQREAVEKRYGKVD